MRQCNLLLLLFIVCACSAKKPHVYILDNSHLFSKEQFNILDSLYRQHEQKTTNEIVLMTIAEDPHTEENLHMYGVSIFNKLGVGKKEKNNGVLILLCMQCKRVEIINGEGTEKVFDDHETKVVIDSFMIPQFRHAKFYEGVLEGSKEIISILEKPENKIK